MIVKDLLKWNCCRRHVARILQDVVVVFERGKGDWIVELLVHVGLRLLVTLLSSLLLYAADYDNDDEDGDEQTDDGEERL